MKNATRYCAGPAYYRMCSTDVYCSKQSTKGNHHPSFLRFWIGQKKTVDAAKICGGAENVVKTETQQTFNGLLGFITLVFILRWKRVYCSHIVMSCPSIWATLSALLINILLGSFFQLFLHSDQPLSEGEIIPCSAVSASRGEAVLSTPEAVVASRTDWQTALMCNRRRPAATSRRASFSALASA